MKRYPFRIRPNRDNTFYITAGGGLWLRTDLQVSGTCDFKPEKVTRLFFFPSKPEAELAIKRYESGGSFIRKRKKS